jgi:glutamate 5-kinase
VILKLGSSIVADEQGQVRLSVLREVCAQVASLRQAGDRCILVSSGAIARGMQVMELGLRPSAMDELQAASAVGQGKLFRAYDELLAAHGIPSAQVLLTFFDLSARSHYLNARQTLRRLLEWDVVPVVNENDTTATDEISFGDNDFLAAQIAILLKADSLLLLTDTDGLYDRDPRYHSQARLIQEVDDFSLLEKLDIGVSRSPLGSGGMRSKVVAAEMATAAGIPTVICNGIQDAALSKALANKPSGTRFQPQRGRVSSFKLWLKYAKPTRGELFIDPGAEKALRQRGTSLLPVGIVDVKGAFQAGDAVYIASSHGKPPIGKGLVNFAADDLRKVKGLKSEQLRLLLPGAGEEAVHRDYFVLY